MLGTGAVIEDLLVPALQKTEAALRCSETRLPAGASWTLGNTTDPSNPSGSQVALSACVCPGVCMEARPPHAPWLTQAAASLPACPSEVIAIFSSLRSLASGGSQGLGIPLPGCLGWCRWELPQGCQAFPGSWLPWTPHPQPPTAQCLQAGQPGTSGTETQGVHPLCPPRSPSPVGRGLKTFPMLLNMRKVAQLNSN